MEPSASTRPLRRPTRRQVRSAVGLGACLLLVALVCTGMTTLLLAQAEQDQLDALAVEADLAADYVGEQQAGLRDVVAAWSSRVEVVEVVGTTGSAALPAETAQVGAQLVASLRRARPGLASAVLVDAEGVALAVAPAVRDVLGRGFDDREWYRQVRATGRPFTTSAYRSALPGRPYVIAAAAPVFDEAVPGAPDGPRLLGMVVASYPLTELQAYTDVEQTERAGRLAVVDAKGQVLAASGQPVRADAALPGDRVSAELLAAPRRLRAGSQAALDDRETGPVDVLGGAARVADLDWRVVVTRPRSVALAGAQQTVWALRLSALGVGLCLAAGWVAWWRVTGRRRADLAVAEGRYRAVYGASPTGIVAVDRQQRVVRSNPAFTAMLGRGPAGPVGRRVGELFRADGRDPEALAALFDGSAATSSEQRLLERAGDEPLAVRLDWSVVRDDADPEAGSVVELACVVTDVSRQAEAHLQLQRAKERAEVLFARAPIGVVEATPDGRISSSNEAFAAMLGRRPEQLVGVRVTDLVERSEHRVGDADDGLLTGEASTAERRFVAADGRSVPVEVRTAVMHDDEGGVDRIAGFVVDLSQVQAQRAALQAAVDELAEAQRLGHLGSFTFDGETHAFTFSEELLRIWGVPRSGELVAEHGRMIHPEDAAGTTTAWRAALRAGGRHALDYRIVRPDGEVRHLRVVFEVAQDTPGRAAAVHGTHLDVTDVAVAQREAVAANAFFAAVLTATPDPTFVTDVETGAIVYASPGGSLLGVTTEQLRELDADAAQALVHPDDRTAHRALAVAAGGLEDGQLLRLRHRARHADGSWHWLSRRTTPFRRDPGTGRVLEVLDVVSDVTDLVEAEQRLTFSALHDPLTGLPNRALLMDRLETALVGARRTGREVAVMFCDLDGFKRVNDTAGHAAGDAVLVETAARLRAVLREHDTVARVGGDEFVVVVEPWNRTTGRPAPNAEPADVRALATELASRIAASLRRPVLVDGVEHVVSTSIGITYGGGDRADATGAPTADHVLQEADAAMYRAKQSGKDRFEVFAPGLRSDLTQRRLVEQVLRRALSPADAGVPGTPATLSTVYQPVVDAGTGVLVGFEALARLADGDGRAIAPDVFIGVAEDSGLIHHLGAQVLRAACRQLATWRAELPSVQGVTMAVNVSALQAQSADLGEHVRRALDEHGLVGSDLVLELTETALLQASAPTLTSLHRLREEGVGIAIDDFGTGCASLRYLATLPVTAVKVDRSFTAGIVHDRVSRTIVQAVARLAADLGLDCVVEGVETDEQRRALPGGVQLQGWLTGRPAAPDQLDVLGLLLAVRPGG